MEQFSRERAMFCLYSLLNVGPKLLERFPSFFKIEVTVCSTWPLMLLILAVLSLGEAEKCARFSIILLIVQFSTTERKHGGVHMYPWGIYLIHLTFSCLLLTTHLFFRHHFILFYFQIFHSTSYEESTPHVLKVTGIPNSSPFMVCYLCMCETLAHPRYVFSLYLSMLTWWRER